MKTGLKDLDRAINFYPGDVIVVGARPGMGKSAFLRQLAIKFAIDEKHVLYVDLQNTQNEFKLRNLCNLSEVERFKLGDIKGAHKGQIGAQLQKLQQEYIDTGTGCSLDGHEYQRVIAAEHVLMDAPLIQKSGWIENPIEYFEKLVFPEVLFIDSIQLLARTIPPREEISSIMKTIKSLAIENETVVFVSSDLTRKVDERPGHWPIILDFSDSSSLEEISDKVLFLLRRDYYDPFDKPGIAELIIAKNNSSFMGNIKLGFRQEIGKYFDY